MAPRVNRTANVSRVDASAAGRFATGYPTNELPEGPDASITRTTNRKRRPVGPEVWFRIVHTGLHGQIRVPDAPKPTFSDQTVEITLGPKGAFENGNVGTLTRRLNVDLVVSATPKPRPSKPKPPSPNPTARAVEALRKAYQWRRLLESGEASHHIDIARREGICRSRVPQIMSLLRLAPEIRELILGLPAGARQPGVSESALRAIAQLEGSEAQLEAFAGLGVSRRGKNGVADPVVNQLATT
jgi:hypothetical protein